MSAIQCSAGRQFHGLTTLSAKKTFTHINMAVARQEFLYAWPLVLWLLLANVKKSSGVTALLSDLFYFVQTLLNKDSGALARWRKLKSFFFENITAGFTYHSVKFCLIALLSHLFYELIYTF